MKEKNKERFLVIAQSWKSNSDDLFIYRVQPQDPTETVLVKHPLYKSYSVFSPQPLYVGDNVEADIEIQHKSKGDQFWVTHVYFDFPDTPSQQWAFLDRVAENKNLKKVVKTLELFQWATPSELVLDKILNSMKIVDNELIILNDDLKDIIEQQVPDFTEDRLRKLYTEINGKQAHSAFVSEMGNTAKLLTDSQISKVLSAYNHSPKSAVAMIQTQLYPLMFIDGIGFKTVDNIREKLWEETKDYLFNPINPERILYGSYAVLEEKLVNSGNTKVDLLEFMKVATQELKIPQDLMEDFLKSCKIENLQSSVDTSVKRNIFNIINTEGFVTTAFYWNAEFEAYNTLKKAKTDFLPHLGKKEFDFQAALDSYLNFGTDFQPSDEQIEVFKMIENNKFSMVVGPGGTGKTKTVSELIKFLLDLRLSVELLAPTGKAAQNLSSYAEYPAKTIHSAYHIIADNINGQGTTADIKKVPDVIFIDEFSMVDSLLFNAFLRNIKTSLHTRTRVVFIGDEFQLASVSPGNLLHLFIKYNLLTTVRLTKSFRLSSTEGGIAKISKEFREGYFTLENQNNKPFVIGKDFIAQNIDDEEKILAQTLNAYKKMLENNVLPEDIMVLSPANKGRIGQVNLNNQLQSLVRSTKNEKHFYEEVSLSFNFFGEEVSIFKDDLVMFRNNREFPSMEDANTPEDLYLSDIAGGDEEEDLVHVNNGDIGKVIDITAHGILVENSVTKEKIMVFKNSLKDEIQLAYAYTIHKSQGSESPYGIMVVGGCHYYQANANLLYTGITRVKSKVYLLGSFRTIRNKVKKFENKNRDTIMEYLILKDKDSEIVF